MSVTTNSLTTGPGPGVAGLASARTCSAGPATGRRISVRRSEILPAAMHHLGRMAWSHHDGLRRDAAESESLELVHTFTTAEICDDVMVAALDELIGADVLHGQWEFEEAAVGLIRSSSARSGDAWAAFYDNSLRSLRDGTASFAPVHRRARSLISGSSVLEVGCCFGLFALQCAETGLTVSACDISAGAIDLLTAAADRRDTPLRAVVGDATALRFVDDSVDTVTLIHLLEHLGAEQARTAITEALRVARRAVVIAVPYEEHPSEHFGHRVTLDALDLQRWSEEVDHAGAEIFTDRGGWLILTPGPPS
ncbi:mycofactocin oligosaccharide methyltransferase MftM [Gordonia sp. DT30]|uniref:mycofactocin oligosaccharide methyltransferase MftM n=1 Tax=unclassified Gordonia (in: high G+C Gram-positive bacteria) TaxID=2657482 RepID=UPI003CE6D328